MPAYSYTASWQSTGTVKFLPVTLVYEEQDWSHPQEDANRRKQIQDAQFVVLPAAGKFSALEVTTRLAEIITANAKPGGALAVRKSH